MTPGWVWLVTGASVGATVVNMTWVLAMRWKFAAIQKLLTPRVRKIRRQRWRA